MTLFKRCKLLAYINILIFVVLILAPVTLFMPIQLIATDIRSRIPICSLTSIIRFQIVLEGGRIGTKQRNCSVLILKACLLPILQIQIFKINSAAPVLLVAKHGSSKINDSAIQLCRNMLTYALFVRNAIQRTRTKMSYDIIIRNIEARNNIIICRRSLKKLSAANPCLPDGLIDITKFIKQS